MERGKCPTPCKNEGGIAREGECPKGICTGNMLRRKCPDPAYIHPTNRRQSSNSLLLLLLALTSYLISVQLMRLLRSLL